MKINTALVLAGLALTGTFCTSPRGGTADAEHIKKEVGQLLTDYVKDINAGGLKNAASYFSEDKRFYWVEDGTVQYPDRAALVKGIEAFAPAVNSVNMQVSDARTDVIDAQHAMLFVQYREDILLRSNYTVKLDGAMTILVERKNNSWKFLCGHSSVKKTRTPA